MILPPASKISQHHKVTNITMSPTSLSPEYWVKEYQSYKLSFLDTMDKRSLRLLVRNRLLSKMRFSLNG